MIEPYALGKALHYVGLIVLIGNVTVTSFWKVMADWTLEPKTIGHAQRAVVVADWVFTVPGLVLTVLTGYWMAWTSGYDPLGEAWLIASQILFVVSGLVWLLILVPIQSRQWKRAQFMIERRRIPPGYWVDGKAWLVWGIVATVPLAATLYLMIAKPAF